MPWCRRYRQHGFNKTTFFLSIFKQYFSGKIEDSGVSRVVEGADPYRLCHVRIDALEANDSSSVSLAYSASLRGKFALQTLRLPPSPTGEGLVCAKLWDRFSTSLSAKFGHNLTKPILPISVHKLLSQPNQIHLIPSLSTEFGHSLTKSTSLHLCPQSSVTA